MAISIAPGRYGRAGRYLSMPTSVTVEAFYNIPFKRKTADRSAVYGELFQKLVDFELPRSKTCIRVLPHRRGFEEAIIP